MALLLTNPPAIIIVNHDISRQIQNAIVRQLHIDVVLDGYTFDQYILSDSNWPNTIKNIYEQRVLVIRDLRELENRQYADVVAFVDHGLITSLYNGFGPPVKSFPVRKIHWGQFCVFVKKKGPGNLGSTCCGCGVDVACTMRQELDALNRRICTSCSCCGSCCSCPAPTYATLLVPLIPGNPGVRGV